MSNTETEMEARAERRPEPTYSRSRFQATILLVEAIIVLFCAWLLQPNPYSYPLGVLVLGAGMALAALVNPYRLAIAGVFTTLVGVAVYMTFKQIIPGNQVLAVYVLAMGLALLVIALLQRRGYVGRGAVSPALLVLLVGVVEYALVSPLHLTPPNFLSFALSLWTPGIVLLVLGLIYLALSLAGRRAES